MACDRCRPPFDLEAQLPAELMRQESTDRLQGLAGFQLLQPEQITHLVRLAVPVRALQDLNGHSRAEAYRESDQLRAGKETPNVKVSSWVQTSNRKPVYSGPA